MGRFTMFSILSLMFGVMKIAAQMPPMADVDIPPSVKAFCTDNSACPDRPLTVGGWNMQRLGSSKISKPEVVSIIVQTIRKYDLIVLQEVTDTSLEATKKLLSELNEGLNENDVYDMIISPKIGTAKYKEQYAYFYKNSTFKYEKGEKYNDSNNKFQIEPFVAKFKVLNDGKLRRFIVIPLHSKPKDAVNEIDALVDVYDEMTKIMKTREAIILGDFNAGCSYVTGNKYQKMRLFTDNRFDWLISDHADTTTKATTCPYDRIVIAGTNMKSVAYYDSAGPFYFDEVFDLEENKELTADVSDHYPVGVLLRNVQRYPTTNEVYKSISSKFSLSSTYDEITQQINLLKDIQGACSLTNLLAVTESSGNIWVQWNCDSAHDAIETLVNSAQYYPELFQPEAVGSLVYKVSVGGLRDYTLFERAPKVTSVEMSFFCFPTEGDLQCRVTMASPTNVN